MSLLGSVEFTSSTGDTLDVPAGKRRSVLALLALEINRVVPVERFFDLVWDGDPPPQARAALQGHIAGLRKLCDGTSLTVVTQAPGYLLRGDEEQVDARRFDRLIAEARTAPDEQATELLGQALALWRGEPLTGVPEGELRTRWGNDLAEARLRTLEEWAQRLLTLGRAGEATGAIEAALREDGLREPLVRLLMLALLQEGRQAEALTAYHRCRRLLADQLGVVPGPALQGALAEVLDQAGSEEPVAPSPTPPARSSAPAPVAAARTQVPRQLPRLQGGLVGRDAETDWLDEQLGADGDGGGLAVVTGAAGSGKSTTVLRWAHQRADGFPDGQLFADLRGLDRGSPVEPHEVCRTFLQALGVPEPQIPDEPARAEDLYRSVTQSLRLLVVLDNVGRADTVRPLIPAGSGSSMVVTSRNVLSDLVVLDGAATLSLGALPVSDAIELVERLVGGERVRAEPEMTLRLVELCDRLPLALRIAVARLTARPAWLIGDLVEELEDERMRLELLDTAGESSVTAALGATLHQLSPDAVRLLTRLALHPGVEIDAPAAAALLGANEQVARAALGILAVFHLVTEVSPGRFTCHDLVRLYSARLGEHDLTAEERQQAAERLLDYYLAATVRAGSFTTLHRGGPPPAGGSEPSLPALADAGQALDWFRREEPTLRALVESASTERAYGPAWRLADAAVTLYHGTGTVSAWLSCVQAGLRAAERSGEPVAVGRMTAAVGAALTERGRPGEAVRHLRQAVQYQEALELSVDLVRSRLALGVAEAALGQHEFAADVFELALEESRRLGDARAEGLTLATMAEALLACGKNAAALDRARQARTILADLPTSNTALTALVSEADAQRRLGRDDESEQLWAEAITAAADLGHTRVLATAEWRYATLLEGLGRRTEALVHLRRAAELAAERHDAAASARIAEDLRRLTEAEADPASASDPVPPHASLPAANA
ncbi:BTAD domain-containing putative transcriptional regulator [Kitasatospora sp. NPDC049285]|uniref:AfsR/SARP family transcriptional regulator n=1 Tax=Kitasatospora sp. NPDC049285 TaxID=3157096 RepID=UPI00343F6E3F